MCDHQVSLIKKNNLRSKQELLLNNLWPEKYQIFNKLFCNLMETIVATIKKIVLFGLMMLTEFNTFLAKILIFSNFFGKIPKIAGFGQNFESNFPSLWSV
jgi:hypothetical protein